ncbi:hypothetical protein ACWCY1_34445, partial [Streptomyces goshikiensis]
RAAGATAFVLASDTTAKEIRALTAGQGVDVVTLYVWGGVARFDPLEGAVGGPFAWAGITVVLSAAACAVLAGVALTDRPVRAGGPSRRA